MINFVIALRLKGGSSPYNALIVTFTVHLLTYLLDLLAGKPEATGHYCSLNELINGIKCANNLYCNSFLQLVNRKATNSGVSKY